MSKLFASNGVVASQKFKCFGLRFQAFTVFHWIVALQGGGCRRKNLKCDIPYCLLHIAFPCPQCFQCHARSIGFAIGGVTGDVRCAYECTLQQLLVDAGLVFPCVDDCSADVTVVQGVNECAFVNYSASSSIDDNRLRDAETRHQLNGRWDRIPRW